MTEKLTLEDLLAEQPPLSPSVKWREFDVCFRVLSMQDRATCRFEAMKMVNEHLQANGLDKDFFGSLPAQDAFNNEFELRILEAAMCRAGTRGPITSIDALRGTITPEEQAFLVARCYAHQEIHDPEKITEESVLACIDEAKKNPIGFGGLLEYGMKTLLISFVTLASELEISRIAESLDGWQRDVH